MVLAIPLSSLFCRDKVASQDDNGVGSVRGRSKRSTPRGTRALIGASGGIGIEGRPGRLGGGGPAGGLLLLLEVALPLLPKVLRRFCSLTLLTASSSELWAFAVAGCWSSVSLSSNMSATMADSRLGRGSCGRAGSCTSTAPLPSMKKT